MREGDEQVSRGGGKSDAVRSEAAADSDVASRLTALAEEPSPRRRRVERIVAARKLVRAEYVYVVALAAFAVLALFARRYAYFAWDVRATLALQSLPASWMLPFMRAVSVFGDGWHGWALAAFAMLAFAARRRRTEMLALLFSVGVGEVVNRVVKWAVGRVRPTPALVHVSGVWARESFPSGHVTFYVCYFGFLFFVAYAVLHRGTNARRAALALAALPVLLIGFSRVYLGAHWASDVLGGYLLSGLWLALTLHLYRRWKARSTFHQDDDKRQAQRQEAAVTSGG